MTQPPLRLDDQFCFALYGASIAVSRLYKPLLDTLGLTYPQFLVLQAVREAATPTVGAIAARLSLDPSTVTPVVKRMEAAGLLRRERDPADERQVRVRLTEAGTILWSRTGCLGERMAAAGGMSPAKLNALNRELRRLQATLARSLDTPIPETSPPPGPDDGGAAQRAATPAKPPPRRTRRRSDQAARNT